MKKNWPVLILLVFVSCNTIKRSSYNPSHKYGAQQLKEDFAVLDKVLKANHPSLYWYSTKDSIDNFFSAAYKSLNDSLTEQQFRKKAAWVINKIHCGHTVVRPSKAYSKYYRNQDLTFFPLLLKVWKDSAVVISNLSKEDTIIKRGTVVTAINGIAVKNIIDSMCQLISADGYTNIFKYQLISFSFPAFYKNAYGTDSNYTVRYIDSVGRFYEKSFKNFESKNDILNNPAHLLPGVTTKKQFHRLKLLSARKMEITDSVNTAILSVNTFSKGNLIHFFHRSFKKIRQKNIKNVVLDLRMNSGGSVIACTRLSQYLINKPFHVSDTVAAYNKSFQYKKFIRPWLIYWLSMHISGKRLEDGRIHFRYFETHLFKPKIKNHFNGNIYILTGGYTFSAAALVARNLKGQPNVTIVGEETGGGAYGNSAMLLTTIVLPHTRLRITLPLFRMVLDAAHEKNGRGIFPDVEVHPSVLSLKTNRDTKMEKVIELIQKQ